MVAARRGRSTQRTESLYSLAGALIGTTSGFVFPLLGPMFGAFAGAAAGATTGVLRLSPGSRDRLAGRAAAVTARITAGVSLAAFTLLVLYR